MDAVWRARVLIAIALLQEVGAMQGDECNTTVSFDPPGLPIAFMDTTQTFHFNFTAPSCSDRPQLFFFSRNPALAVVKEIMPPVSINKMNASSDECVGEGDFTVAFELIGKTYVDVYMICNLNSSSADLQSGVTLQHLQNTINHSLIKLNDTFELRIIRYEGILDYAFIGVIYFFVIAATIGMGIKTDLKVVKEVLRRPIAPVIGFISQYTIMPLAAFGLAKAIGFPNNLGFALFVAGCCPGGGFSNVWTYLFKGDVSLSVTMTLVSTLASLAMLPFWIFTLGQVFIDDTFSVQIPFVRIVLTLLSIVIPIGVGILAQRYFPKISKWYLKIITPIFIVIFVLFFTAGIYINLFMFRLITAASLVAGCCLPLLGFILGGVVALICRQSKPRVITIAIETGIQNYGIAIILMKFSLPPPDGDISLIPPFMASMFTPVPLLIAYVVFFIYMRFIKKKTVLDDIVEVAEIDGTHNKEKDDKEAQEVEDDDTEKRKMLEEDKA